MKHVNGHRGRLVVVVAVALVRLPTMDNGSNRPSLREVGVVSGDGSAVSKLLNTNQGIVNL